MKRPPSRPTKVDGYRRPSASLEIGAACTAVGILSLSMLFSDLPILERLAAIAMYLLILAIGATAVSSHVFADEWGIRVGWTWWVHTRVPWSEVDSVEMPSGDLPWGYPFVRTTCGGRASLRPLRCHRHGWNHNYAAHTVQALNRMKRGEEPTTWKRLD